MKTRAEAIARMQELNNSAKAEGRDMTEKELEEFQSLKRHVEELDKQKPGEGAPAAGGQGETPPAGGDDAVLRGITEERGRVTAITAMCKEFDLSPQEFISRGMSLEDAQAAVLKELKKDGVPARVRVTEDEGEVFREAASDALLVRAGLVPLKDAPKANGMTGLSLRALAEECLEKDGITGLRRMADDQVMEHIYRQFFSPTAFFPSIVDQAIKKSYTKGYEAMPYTYERFCGKGSLTDFKETHGNWLAGDAGDFLLVPEGGEIKHDVPADIQLPTRKLAKYGRQFTITYEAFVNDDISFITTVPNRYARSMRRTINSQVFGVLYENKPIYDGKTLFHTDHKNLLAEGSAPSIKALQKMLLKLRLQKDQHGNAIIIEPRYIVVPVGYQFDLYAILCSESINTPGNTQAKNPLFNLAIEVLEDPTLNALVDAGNPCPWFLCADQSSATAIQIDYLNGMETPTLKRSEKSGTLGFIWDFWGFWGVNVLDYRGVVKNPGVALDLE